MSGFALIALALALALFLQSRLFASFVLVWAPFGIGLALIDPARILRSSTNLFCHGRS